MSVEVSPYTSRAIDGMVLVQSRRDRVSSMPSSSTHAACQVFLAHWTYMGAQLGSSTLDWSFVHTAPGGLQQACS